MKSPSWRPWFEAAMFVLIRATHYPLRHPTMALRGRLEGRVWCPDCLKAYGRVKKPGGSL